MSKLEQLRASQTNAALATLRDAIAAMPKSREASIAQTHFDTALVVRDSYGAAAHEEITRQLQLCQSWLTFAPQFEPAAAPAPEPEPEKGDGPT